MKRLFTMAILTLAVSGAGALAQVYGTNDNPYEVNPYASNMVIEPAPTPTPAPAAQTPAPAPQDSGKAQQTAASSAGQDAKKPAAP